jgi:ABC-2 type transport system ATP-binding protein
VAQRESAAGIRCSAIPYVQRGAGDSLPVKNIVVVARKSAAELSCCLEQTVLVGNVSDSAIRVEGLVKNYGSIEALKGIDFEVPHKTIFGLLGPNGAGKTTAIRILSTILRPDGGRAEVMGYDVVHQPQAVRFQIGLAGQNAAVDPNLTGRENLQMIGRLAQLSRRVISPRVDELLEGFGLTKAANRPLRTYSGGMLRRLDVAAALVPRPPVIFLDEPTTGLDIQSRTELWALIRQLVSEGSTVLLTTQYLEEADQLADRIAVVSGGQIVANDTAAALKARLGTTTIEFEMGDEQAGERAAEVIARVTSDGIERDGATVRLISGRGPLVLVETLSALQISGLTPQELSVREPTLDEVFLRLTGDHCSTGEDDVGGVQCD